MMAKRNPWYRKQYPHLKPRELWNLVLCLILPNIFFLLLAWYTQTSRPLINFDYLLALFLLLLPWTWVRIIGAFGFLIAMLFDTIMLIIQIFPFMDLAAIRYLAGFITQAPTHYLFFCVLLVMGGAVLLYIAMCLSKKLPFPYPHFVVLFVGIFAYVFMHLGINYARFDAIMGRDNYYIAHSQIKLYKQIKDSDFLLATDTTPEFEPIIDPTQHAVSQLKTPYSSKILYILSESWGELRNPQANKAILAEVLKHPNLFEFVDYGTFHTSGATVAGELREICSVKLKNSGFAFGKLSTQQFVNCLPNQLAQQGYKTVAMHGTSGLLYDRTQWYKYAGFQQRYFGEHFMQLKRCTAFKGVCDTELMQEVAKIFKQYSNDKIFFYWMTLTSHQPYSIQDIHNHRFDCQAYDMNPEGDACRNAKLQTQFLDELLELVKQPEMVGVEVMVVGDHQAPVWGHEINHIRSSKVSYLHFKVK